MVSSVIVGGDRSVRLLRFGLPGQLASINGSDIGTLGELELSATDFGVENDVGGSGGVRFLDTDLIMSGDESTLTVVVVGSVVAALVQATIAGDADIITGAVLTADVGELLFCTVLLTWVPGL